MPNGQIADCDESRLASYLLEYPRRMKNKQQRVGPLFMYCTINWEGKCKCHSKKSSIGIVHEWWILEYLMNSTTIIYGRFDQNIFIMVRPILWCSNQTHCCQKLALIARITNPQIWCTNVNRIIGKKARKACRFREPPMFLKIRAIVFFLYSIGRGSAT